MTEERSARISNAGGMIAAPTRYFAVNAVGAAISRPVQEPPTAHKRSSLVIVMKSPVGRGQS